MSVYVGVANKRHHGSHHRSLGRNLLLHGQRRASELLAFKHVQEGEREEGAGLGQRDRYCFC